jgi:hypothetical protein
MLRRREDKGGPIQLLFLMIWLGGGVEVGKKEHRTSIRVGYTLFYPPLKDMFQTLQKSQPQPPSGKNRWLPPPLPP